MHAIFSRRVVVDVVGSSSSLSQLTRMFKKKPTLPHRSQSRHFVSLLAPSFVPSLPSRSEKLYGLFATTLRNTNLKLKLGNLMESRAGFFDSELAFKGIEFETKGFTGFQKRGWKSWFDGTNGVVFGLIIANAAVFTMWRASDRRYHRLWMIKNFALTTVGFLSGGIHTLITQGFSNFGIAPFIMNMLQLYYFGTRIANILGVRYLLKLYCAGTLGGSVCYLSYHALVALLKGHGVVVKNQFKPNNTLLGADGAVFAITLLDIFLYPKVTTYFRLMLRVPIMAVTARLGYNMLMMLEGQQKEFPSGSNQFGGAMVAVIAWNRLRKGRFC